jgi:hypothetical protein
MLPASLLGTAIRGRRSTRLPDSARLGLVAPRAKRQRLRASGLAAWRRRRGAPGVITLTEGPAMARAPSR